MDSTTKNINLENLPKKKGFGVNKDKILTDWHSSIGEYVDFQYRDVIGKIQIVGYKKGKLTIKYQNKEYQTSTSHFRNCQLGRFLGKQVSPTKITYRFKIGDILKDKNRHIEITNKEIRVRYKPNNDICNDKYYKFKCHKCGWNDGWIEEHNLKKGVGCSCCSGKIVVPGINDIPTTANWMVKYFQGGYEEAKKYTKASNNSIYVVCPDCKNNKSKPIGINTLYRERSIGCEVCGDGFSYPEKFIKALLDELNLNFICQLNKSNFSWIKNYRYDFYIPENKIIIETHGIQHYVDNIFPRKLKDEQENDKIKKNLALKNGIKDEDYIVIDCRKSDFKWIKESIYNSNLSKYFDLSKVDWEKVQENALSNKVKDVCKIRRENPNISTTEIGKIANISRDTVVKYLKIGNNLGWCEYTNSYMNKACK